MSTFEGVLAALAFLGIGVPAWIFSLAIYHLAKRPRKSDPGARFSAYVAIVDRLFEEMDKEHNRAAIILVCFRELREFPEFRDITIAMLGIINVTGKSFNDRMLIDELKATEDFLLSSSK